MNKVYYISWIWIKVNGSDLSENDFPTRIFDNELGWRVPLFRGQTNKKHCHIYIQKLAKYTFSLTEHVEHEIRFAQPLKILN